ncbi:PREDICTED: uncharacterized protein LOC105148376 [Acromyrmex echinatior]|uniref:uncharacterized protein LOC105148376 n=1 Tax=Acromyrmex echinatior TaxID=103372 RepID=UPI000580B9F0|nr:PREDICTED: uncharacterized protein LOC105148376 [Acromyrmex echinatior]
MSHPSRLKQPKHHYLKLRVMEGTKWDRPFPKPKEYWKKFCDDEEKRLIRVRNSFPKSPYLPIIPILRDLKTDVRDIIDSSVPRSFDENVLLVDPKSSEAPDISSIRDNENFISNAREPIVKISPPTPKKPSKNDAITIARTNAEEQHILVTIQNKSTIKKVDSYKEPESLDVSSKNSIIPHDGSRDGRIYSKKTCPFHRYEPMVKIFDDDIERYLTEDPRANVSLGEKLNKLPHVQNASKYDKDKNRITSVESKKIKRVTIPQKECYLDNTVDLTTNALPNLQTQLEQTIDNRMQEFLNYSQRCAYKALKRLTLNKNLNFKPEVWEETSVRSRASTDRSIIDTNESDVAESESPESRTHIPEFPFSRERQRRLRETWAANIEEQGVKYKLLKLNSDKSSMVPAKSLTKSAFSTKFAKYETWENRSAKLLDAIPRISCFRRKNRDRCLSCMHKSLRKANETEAVSSRALLLTEIEAKDDSESSSDGLPEFREELRKILYSQRKEILRYPETVEDGSSKSASSSLQMEQEDTEISMQIDPIQSKDKTPKPTESLLSKDPKSLKATSSSISISSDIEQSKISSSEVHTSDDETSSPLDNDSSQYKNMAPCHLPTILVPSMEPLRALRHKKPIIMESRIALMKTATLMKEESDNEYYDDEEITKERPPSKTTSEKSEKADEKKDTLTKTTSALLKVKSQQQLISPIVESARKGELKRGYSYASIKDLSKDSTRRTFEIPRGKEEGGQGKVIPVEEIDSAKGSTSSDSVKAEREN